MKLNNKRTFLVGLAFLSICAFWQMYDSVIPLILKNTFHIGDTFSGVIMAADNVLALFLLPFFGALSDGCKSPLGKRMPFILTGTGLAVVFMTALPLLDNIYYAVPAPWVKVLFIVALGLLLISMGIYRSPAVALMPDVTPKPLRSKANAIINLMGAVGGIIFLIVSSILYSEKRVAGLAHVNYLPLFLIVAGIMLVAVALLYATIKERKIELEMKAYEAAHPEDDLDTDVDSAGKAALPPEVKRSLAFILLSIALWFMGYNAVTTSFTKYAQEMWHMSLGSASMCLTVATAGAIISYIPIGALASKIGRKRTIQGGVLLLSVCFAGGFVYTLLSDRFSPLLYVLFALVGLAWAAINVNSLPMVVEMCRGSDIGKFTGYYYTFSMAAQTITPILSGALLEHVGYKTLFPYAAVFVALSFFTMSLVKHGDNRPTPVKGIEAFEDMD